MRPPRRSSGRGRRSRYPDDGYDDYDADPDDRPEPRRRRSPRGEQGGGGLPLPSAATLGRLIQLATGLIALAFVLHVIFVVAGADQANGFVSFTYSVAKTFVFGLGDVFHPGDPTLGVVVNYGLAAFIYLWGGRLVGRALKG